jgi:hypothetical protein
MQSSVWRICAVTMITFFLYSNPFGSERERGGERGPQTHLNKRFKSVSTSFDRVGLNFHYCSDEIPGHFSSHRWILLKMELHGFEWDSWRFLRLCVVVFHFIPTKKKSQIGRTYVLST